MCVNIKEELNLQIEVSIRHNQLMQVKYFLLIKFEIFLISNSVLDNRKLLNQNFVDKT